MAKKVIIESVEERKDRIKGYLNGEDPVVRFVDGNGMGLRHLYSEEVVLPPEYDYVEEPTRDIVKVRKGHRKYGFVHVSGRIITPCIYDRADIFSDGRACVEEIGRFCGFINEEGKEIISLRLEDYRRTLPSGAIQYLPVFENGRAIIVKNGLEGIIGLDGKEIIPCQYEDIRRCNTYGWTLRMDQLCGFAFNNGRIIIPCKYQFVRLITCDGPYPEQVFIVGNDGKKGLLDIEGKELLPLEYDSIEPFEDRFHPETIVKFQECHKKTNGLLKVKVNGKVGVATGQGVILIKPQFDDVDVISWDDEKPIVRHFITSAIKTKLNYKYGAVALDGSEIITPSLDPNEVRKCLKTPSESFIRTQYSYDDFLYHDKESGLYGIRKPTGEKLTEPKYKQQPWHIMSTNGRYFIQVEERPDYHTKLFGLVDEKGVEVMPCIYDDCGITISDGLIFATKKKKEGVFSLDGEPIIKCAWWECRSAEAGTIWAEKKNTCALFTRSGAIVLEEGPYDKCSPSADGLLELRSSDDCKWYYMDLWGNKTANN